MYTKIVKLVIVIGLVITFFYFVAWPPVARTSCADTAKAYASRNVGEPTNADSSNKYFISYSGQYMLCINAKGIAE